MQHCVSVYSFKCPSKVFYYFILLYFILLYLFFLLCILGISRFTLLLSVSAVKTAVFVLCYLILVFCDSPVGEGNNKSYVLVEYFFMMRENHPNKWFLLELFSVFIWDIWLGHRLIDWPAQLWMVKRQHILTLTWFLFNLQYILRFLIFKN